MKSKLILPCIFVVALFACDNDDDPSITYPDKGFYGDNILFLTKSEFITRDNSLNSGIPKARTLKIKITGKTVTAGGLLPSGIWYYDPGTVNNWAIAKMDMTEYSQMFTSIDGGITCDVRISFDDGTFLIEYFENDSTTPTHTKTIVVKKV